MRMLSQSDVLKIQKEYPKGTRIMLLSPMDDIQGKPAGSTGTVYLVDGIGSIHVKWDSGGSLAVIPEIDNFKKI